MACLFSCMVFYGFLWSFMAKYRFDWICIVFSRSYTVDPNSFGLVFTEFDKCLRTWHNKLSKNSFGLQSFLIWLLLGIPGILVTFYLKATSKDSSKIMLTNITTLLDLHFDNGSDTSQLECHEIKEDWETAREWSMYLIQGTVRFTLMNSKYFIRLN